MNLKEAFRYQNYLTSMFDDVALRLTAPNVVRVTETHNRSKANPESGIDEELDNTAKRDFDCSIDELVEIAMFLIDEKTRLSHAISEAKAAHCRYMDAEIGMNQMRRKMASILKRMSSIRLREDTTVGHDYMLNNEKNQVMYNYEIKCKIEPDFDIAAVRAKYKNIADCTETMSTSIDMDMINVQLEGFEPVFNPSDSMDDVILIYKNFQQRHAQSIPLN